jgi:tetratricopeptide (TPR) repeat protein
VPTARAKAVDVEFQRGLKLQKEKKAYEAELAYVNLLSLDSKHADAYHNLGLIRLTQGQAAIALPYLLYSVELKPESAEAHNTLGNAWTKLGKTAEAEKAFRRAVSLKPKYAQGWFNLANFLATQRRGEEAEKAYRSAIAAKPDYAEAYLNLGNLLRTPERREEALKLLKKLIEIAPKYDLAHNNLGNIYRDLDKLSEAAASYRRSLEINPYYALGWLNLGTVLNHLGRQEDSIAALRRAISVAPRFGEPYMQLASTVSLELADPAVEAMQYYYGEPAVTERDRMYLAFGLGRVFDRHGQHQKAFDYWKEGNRLKRATLNYDVADERARAQRIKAQFSKAFLQKAPASHVADRTPIFIIGMMRSGTTLMEQILASHPQVASGDELMWIPEIAAGFKSSGRPYPESIASATADELTRMGNDYISRLRDRFGKEARNITDKLPGNFFFVGLIHLILPNAKIIHMQRDPYDTCLSIYSNLFAQSHYYAYDLGELGEFYAIYRDMMKHWDQVLPGKVYHQQYEELIASPEATIRKVLAHCELPFDPRCLEFHKTERRVRTASSQQVREPLNDRSIGRWRNYESQIAQWKAVLGAKA